MVDPYLKSHGSVIRFPSLTFVPGAGGSGEPGNTAIKNANLKSELIVDQGSRPQSPVQKHLFENVQTSATSDELSSSPPRVSLDEDDSNEMLFRRSCHSNFSQMSADFDQDTTDTITELGDATLTSRRTSLENSFLAAHQRRAEPLLNIGLAAVDERSSLEQQDTLDAPTQSAGHGSDEESFIYHDTSSLATSLNPEMASVLNMRRSRRASRMGYPGGVSAGLGVSTNESEQDGMSTASHSPRKKFLFDDPASMLQITPLPQLATSPPGSVFNSSVFNSSTFSNMPSPLSSHHPKRYPTVSHVRQVSKRLFSVSKDASDRRSVTDESTLVRTPVQKSFRESATKKLLTLSPIDDYDYEDQPLPDTASLLSRPFRKRRYTEDFADENERRGPRTETQQKQLQPQSQSQPPQQSQPQTLQTPYRYGTFVQREEDDDEDDVTNGSAQFYYGSPHNFKPGYYRQNAVLKLVRSLLYALVCVLLSAACVRLLVLKNCDNSLLQFSVSSLDNILMSDELLLFDISSLAKNPNIQDVSIWGMDLDVFMQTSTDILDPPTQTQSDTDSPPASSDVAILLGNSNAFVTPLKFLGVLNSLNGTSSSLPAEIWRRITRTSDLSAQQASGQVKIQRPGRGYRYKGQPLTSEQWSAILNSKYKIIVRGSFKYHLPLMKHSEIVSVSSDVEVNPVVREAR